MAREIPKTTKLMAENCKNCLVQMRVEDDMVTCFDDAGSGKDEEMGPGRESENPSGGSLCSWSSSGGKCAREGYYWDANVRSVVLDISTTIPPRWSRDPPLH